MVTVSLGDCHWIDGQMDGPVSTSLCFINATKYIITKQKSKMKPVLFGKKAKEKKKKKKKKKKNRKKENNNNNNNNNKTHLNESL